MARVVIERMEYVWTLVFFLAVPLTATAQQGSAKPGSSPKTTKPKKAKKKSPVDEALDRACDAFDDYDIVTVRAQVDRLEALGESPEALAAQGLLDFMEGDFSASIENLHRSHGVAGEWGHETIARSAMFTARYGLAREVCNDHEFQRRNKIRKLLDGPFRGRYPNAHPLLEQRSPSGSYRVITDLGLGSGYLDALESRLASAPDAKSKARLLAKARRSHSGLEEVMRTLDQAYQAYAKLFGLKEQTEVVPTVYVFSRKADFAEYTEYVRLGKTENVLGYYSPSYRVLVLYDQDRGGKGGRHLDSGTLETLMHETFHQWMHLFLRHRPIWFNEGLAEYFSKCVLSKKKLRYGLVPKRYPSRLSNIREALAGQLSAKSYDLEVLLRADRKTWKERSAVCYAQAWSFCHYLGSTAKGRKILRRYFRALRDGLDIEQAYQQVFAKVNLAALESKWLAYLNKLR